MGKPVNTDGEPPEVGRTTHLANGGDMTLIDYTQEEEGDTFTWSLTFPQ